MWKSTWPAKWGKSASGSAPSQASCPNRRPKPGGLLQLPSHAAELATGLESKVHRRLRDKAQIRAILPHTGKSVKLARSGFPRRLLNKLRKGFYD